MREISRLLRQIHQPDRFAYKPAAEYWHGQREESGRQGANAVIRIGDGGMVQIKFGIRHPFADLSRANDCDPPPRDGAFIPPIIENTRLRWTAEFDTRNFTRQMTHIIAAKRAAPSAK